MLYCLLSPAKKLNTERKFAKGVDFPILANKANELALRLKELNASDIKNLMKLSDKLSTLNYERNQIIHPLENNDSEYFCALPLFEGDSYKHLDCSDFTEAQWAFCQKTLGILSGLYGLIKPLDLIQPYRLEMKTKLKTAKHNDLYAFWQDHIYKSIESVTNDNTTIINLASSEYSQAANLQKINRKVITINFKQQKGMT